jgi:signal-transduction protein with cAMP-binding, CBS, and nucleotidyltransferase domain
MSMSVRPRTRGHHRVATVMSWPVATVEHEVSVEEVAEALCADELGAVLVLADGALVGIVSERDIVRHVAAGANLAHLKAGEVMTGDLTTVQVDDTILDAARLMSEAGVRHLPVLQGSLIAGVVSVRDVLDVLVGELV